MRLAAVVLFMSTSVSGAPASLAPCPKTPNCVASQAADAGHFVEPLRFSDAPEQAWARLKSVLSVRPRTRIVEASADYLHAEATSRWLRFVDDVEFLMQADQGLIQVRSASRVGYGDFGVNRRRIEAIRRAFEAGGRGGG